MTVRVVRLLVECAAIAVFLSAATAARAAPEPAAAAASATAGQAAPSPSGSASEGAAEASEEAEKRAFEASLGFRSGKIPIADVAELNLPESFRYIGPEDAAKVLRAWGNLDGSDSLGMLFPKDLGPFDDNSWAVVITHVSDGHVSDEDAEETDFDELLKDMRKGTEEDNAERRKHQLATAELIGWAEPPHYDKATHKIYWAKELSFSDSKTHTLNYSIRVLGRVGVLELNAVASTSQLRQVKAGMSEVLNFVEFTNGNRYTDYKEGDKTAAYGIAALVAGGVAAKTGLLKGLFLALLAAKKFVVVGIVALFAAVKGFLA
ncbi:MAG TPA: DUF2167 domain-containing protein, partial [Polyangiaceae bacterium]|nr:DUF2167 domain-containing protein [Polyangiaceae bacterium]